MTSMVPNRQKAERSPSLRLHGGHPAEGLVAVGSRGDADAAQRFGRVLHPVLGHRDEEAFQGLRRVKQRTVRFVQEPLNDRGTFVYIYKYIYD